jgi:hypothetical protein
MALNPSWSAAPLHLQRIALAIEAYQPLSSVFMMGYDNLGHVARDVESRMKAGASLQDAIDEIVLELL